jgi:ABC-type branched-subunit amino acid transport system ATPase component
VPLKNVEDKGFTAVKRRGASTVRRNTVHSRDRPEWRGQEHAVQPAHQVPRADAGSITYKGATSPRTPPAQLARQGVVRSFQISAVFPHLTRGAERVRAAAAHDGVCTKGLLAVHRLPERTR